jgi:alpha-L-arabinofuranosidase
MPPVLRTAVRESGVPAPAGDLVVYDNALAGGWQDWSWGSDRNFANAAPALGGSGASIAVTFTQDSAGRSSQDFGTAVHATGRREPAGLPLRAPSPAAGGSYSAIRFWVFGAPGSPLGSPGAASPAGPKGGSLLTFYTQTSDGGRNASSIARINIQNRTNGALPPFYVDDIRLLGMPAHVTATIQVGAASAGTSFSPRLLGSNLPSWLGPGTLSDATFRARIGAASIGLLRIPGGSWSDGYGWLSCELGADVPGRAPCGWNGWEARPTDFINILRAQQAEGMWTVNINTTSREAAAAVAFFNARITDTTSIGTDIHGTDWYTSGHWAALRAMNGNPEPLGIHYWEFGNEIYGGLPVHAYCQPYGWETTWTCDGTEYINGVGSGSARHEGYLEFRAAMRAVDPSIVLGASGTDDAAGYSNWGTKVISAAGSVMDFYIVHPYAYDTPPANNASGRAQILALPQTHWSGIRAALQPLFDTYAPGRTVPIAVTEYNLVSSWTNDNQQLMTRAVDTLFIADSIGQMAQNGYALGIQWALANGTSANGTDYGLLKGEAGYTRTAQYYAFPLWARFGSSLLPLTTSVDAAVELSVYAGRVNSTTLTLLAINKTDNAMTATITLNGSSALAGGAADVVQAPSLSAQAVTFNGAANPTDDLSSVPPLPFSTGSSNTFAYTFTPDSITLLTMHTVSVTPSHWLYLPLLRR